MSAVSNLKNRNFIGLLVANTILGAAFPIQLILGGLSGLMLAPNPTLATLPSSVQTVAALVAAAPISILMGRFGRRAGFTLGGLLTLSGAIAATQALYSQNFVLLCASHFLMGAGWTAFQYFRFAASEVVDPIWRPVAISLMLSSLLMAAILGPQVFLIARDALASIPFAGAYAATGIIALLGLVPLAAVKIPKPTVTTSPARHRLVTARAALHRPTIKRAVGIAAVSQGVMVFLMIPTPIAMVSCGFNEASASDAVRWHIVAMFAPSFFTGFLIKRFGAQTIAVFGLVIIVVAAVIAATGLSAGHFYGALVILGLGWNFGYVGATTMLDAAVTPDEKAAVQGANDTIIALVSTICAFSAGVALSTLGWATLAMVSAGLVLVALAAPRLRRAIAPQT